MIPTPDLSHLTRKDYDLIYEPAGTKPHTSCTMHPHTFPPIVEDTFVLLDALEKDVDELKKLQPSICLEVGWVNQSIWWLTPDRRTSVCRAGSGCVSTFLSSILGQSSRENPHTRFVIAFSHPSLVYLATDINPHACRCTVSTARRNKATHLPTQECTPLTIRRYLVRGRHDTHLPCGSTVNQAAQFS